MINFPWPLINLTFYLAKEGVTCWFLLEPPTIKRMDWFAVFIVKQGDSELRDRQSNWPWHDRWGSVQLLNEAQTGGVSCEVAATATPHGCANRWIHQCQAKTE